MAGRDGLACPRLPAQRARSLGLPSAEPPRRMAVWNTRGTPGRVLLLGPVEEPTAQSEPGVDRPAQLATEDQRHRPAYRHRAGVPRRTPESLRSGPGRRRNRPNPHPRGEPPAVSTSARGPRPARSGAPRRCPPAVVRTAAAPRTWIGASLDAGAGERSGAFDAPSGIVAVDRHVWLHRGARQIRQCPPVAPSRPFVLALLTRKRWWLCFAAGKQNVSSFMMLYTWRMPCW